MRELPKLKKDYVQRTAKMKLSNRAMADFMYALVITKSNIEASLGIGIYEYTRKQNSTHRVEFLINIHPENIAQFEEISGSELREPMIMQLN